MLLQQQQKQHCLFMKHKTDKKTKNAKKNPSDCPTTTKNYITNIYENHYIT